VADSTNLVLVPISELTAPLYKGTANGDQKHMERSSTISAEMAQRIELWPIERLIAYERNARTHSDHQIRQIANSIAEFGFTNPILVDTQAGIIAGHARLLAARQLRLPQVPVIVLSHLSDAQKRAYILADNRLALDAGWDDELLRQEL
jgi:ParB-like chromosome segregation protein Spo0J